MKQKLSPRSAHPAFVLFLAVPFLLLYRFTTNQDFSFDAVTNAIACETNEPIRWFHPNHPLYPFVGVFWYRLEKLFGYQGYAIYSLARFNTLLMSAALGILFYCLTQEIGKFRAGTLTAFLGVTYAVWHYAVDGRAVGASVFCSALLIAFLLRLDRKIFIKSKDKVLLGILSSFLILMHAIAIFHVIPLAVWLWWREHKCRKTLPYLLTVGTVLTLVYVAVYFYVARPFSHDSFLRWAIGYAGFEGTTKVAQSPFWFKNGSDVITGLVTGWMRAVLVSPPGKGGILLSLLVSGGLLLWLLSLFVRAVIRSRSNRLPLILVLIAWGGLVHIFLAFWSPGQDGFRLHVLIPWLVAAALCLPDSKAFQFLGLGTALLFYVNFTYAIYPASFIQNNIGYQVLSEIQSRVRAGDLVLAGQAGAVPGIEVLRAYFFPQIMGGTVEGRLLAFHERNLGTLFDHLSAKKTQGENLYFADDLFDPAVQRAIDSKWELKPGEMEEFVGKFKPQEFFTLPNRRQVYRVDVKG